MNIIQVLLNALLLKTSIELPLNSTACASVSASIDGDCTVTMVSGETYDISKEQALGLLSAQSPGRYFNMHIKGK